MLCRLAACVSVFISTCCRVMMYVRCSIPVYCVVQAATFIRKSVVDGDAEMVRMLIEAKGDVNNRDSNVGVCMHGFVRL